MNQLRQLIRVLDALREVTGLYFVWKCSERSWLPLLPLLPRGEGVGRGGAARLQPPSRRELAVSPSHFTHLFKEAVGIGFREYLQRLRVAEAKHLIELTDLPVGAVASECGIPDQSRLARLFQRYWGVTPGALRRRRFDGV